MITPKQNAIAINELDNDYFIKDLDFGPISHSDLRRKAKALIKFDRSLAEYENYNAWKKHPHRQISICFRVLTRLGKEHLIKLHYKRIVAHFCKRLRPLL